MKSAVVNNENVLEYFCFYFFEQSTPFIRFHPIFKTQL